MGISNTWVDVDGGPRDISDSNNTKYWRGYRQYELTNHLGNVLATVSDKKKGVDSNSDGVVDYYEADVVSAQDYYPFGMLMPGRTGYRDETGAWVSEAGSDEDTSLPADLSISGRSDNLPEEYRATASIELEPGFESGSGDAFLAYISPEEVGEGGDGSDEGGSSLSNGYYRYGFNGKENDNEVKGTGNQQDYGMRIYDPRLGRFLSIDPLTQEYPFYTPYQFAGNTPVRAVDLDGAEGIISMFLPNPFSEENTAKLKNKLKITTGSFADKAIDFLSGAGNRSVQLNNPGTYLKAGGDHLKNMH